MADAGAYNRFQGNQTPDWMIDPSVPAHRQYLTPRGDGPNAGFWPDYRDPGNEVVQRGAILPFARYQDGRIHPAMPSLLDGPIQGLATAATIDPRENSADANNRLSQAAFDVGGLAAVSGMMAPRPVNSLGMFGGRMAKTADQGALAEAERLAASGAPREDIWNKTGWFQGPDKKWRFEIDDSKTTIGRVGPRFEPFDDYWYGQTGEGKLGSILKDKSGERAAYPQIDADPTHITMGGNSGQRFMGRITANAEDATTLRSILLHEKQHGIQEIENFARGGNSRMFTADQIAAERARLGSAEDSGNGWTSVSTYDPSNPNQRIAEGLYNRLAGEAEARLVQKRMDMTAEQRRARAPWLDYDVPESQQIVRNALQGPEMSTPPLMRNALQTEAQPGIRAYHGSPHDFDRFDISKIGTGEGAQAYGHGLYFAENEKVAKGYRDALTGTDNIRVGGDPLNISDPVHKAAYALHVNGGDRAKARQALEFEANRAERASPTYAARSSEAARLAGDPNAALPEVKGGRMYEVNIKADPEHFLDWDKPLSQQSEKVRDSVRQTLIDRGLTKSVADYVASSDRPGRDALSALARGEYNTRLNVPDGELAAQASAKLRDAGLHGIKYLDQGSRTAGEGSRNYVVFDPAKIEIMRKYGLLGPTAGIAGGGLLDQPQGQ